MSTEKEIIVFECLNHRARFEVFLVLTGEICEIHASGDPCRDVVYVGRGRTLMEARLNIIAKWLGLDHGPANTPRK